MRKTKIVCTLGPSTDQPGILRQLLENGMNVARFNFSHGDYAEHKGRLDQLRALSKELDVSWIPKARRSAWANSRTARSS
jgi:pyruvate kinase